MAVGDGSDPHLVSVVTTGPATVDNQIINYIDVTRASTNLKEYCG